MTRLLLIRHGMTDAVGRTLAGRQRGIHLNDAGRVQAAAAADALAAVSLAAVLSSPLERAMETASAVAGPHRLRVEVAEELNEFDTGAWTGAAFADLDWMREWQRFNDARSLAAAPGGESMIDVQRRVVAYLLGLRPRFPEHIVAAVSHGDVIRAALVYFLGMPIDLFARLDVAPGRISVVDLQDGTAIVRQVNGDTAGPAV